MHKQVKQVLDAAEKQGFIVVKPGETYQPLDAEGKPSGREKKNKGSRVRVTRPGYSAIVFITPGPSDSRTVKNDIRWLRSELDFKWNGH